MPTKLAAHFDLNFNINSPDSLQSKTNSCSYSSCCWSRCFCKRVPVNCCWALGWPWDFPDWYSHSLWNSYCLEKFERENWAFSSTELNCAPFRSFSHCDISKTPQSIPVSCTWTTKNGTVVRRTWNETVLNFSQARPKQYQSAFRWPFPHHRDTRYSFRNSCFFLACLMCKNRQVAACPRARMWDVRTCNDLFQFKLFLLSGLYLYLNLNSTSKELFACKDG